jgi:hypothetical protein
LYLDLNEGITAEGVEALVEGLSFNTSLLSLPRSSLPNHNNIHCYLQANKTLTLYREREQSEIFHKLWPDIYATLLNHPAALHCLLKETNPHELPERFELYLAAPKVIRELRSQCAGQQDEIMELKTQLVALKANAELKVQAPCQE